jgi:hypothetical protein
MGTCGCLPGQFFCAASNSCVAACGPDCGGRFSCPLTGVCVDNCGAGCGAYKHDCSGTIDNSCVTKCNTCGGGTCI